MTLGDFKELTKDHSDDLELVPTWGIEKFNVWEIFTLDKDLRLELTRAEKS